MNIYKFHQFVDACVPLKACCTFLNKICRLCGIQKRNSDFLFGQFLHDTHVVLIETSVARFVAVITQEVTCFQYRSSCFQTVSGRIRKLWATSTSASHNYVYHKLSRKKSCSPWLNHFQFREDNKYRSPNDTRNFG